LHKHFSIKINGGEDMKDPANEIYDALDGLIKWSRERELPPGDLTVPLQDIINDDESPIKIKWFPFPIAIYGRGGVIEYANDKMLEGTGLTADDIKTGKVHFQNIYNFDFDEAIRLALRGETHVVSDLENPLEYISLDVPDNAPEYKSAIFYSMFSDEAPTRGVVIYLPFDYRPDNA
jgi:hypothetical protein